MIDFFEFSNEMLCLADQRGYFTRLNRAWTTTLGWSVDELLSRPYLDFLHPGDVAATIQEVKLLVNGGYETIEFENRYRCPDGSYRWLAWYGTLEPDSGQLIGAARDITDQKLQAEALRVRDVELQQSQDELLLALDAARMGTWSLNLSTKTVTWSKTAEAMLGYGLGEFPGSFDAFLTAVHPEDREGVTNSIAARVQYRTDHQHVHQFRVVWPDGSVRWLESKGQPYFTPDGTPLRIIGVSTDITERKTAEEAILAKQELLKQLYESQENERRLVAFELHDGPIQFATAAMMHLDAYKESLPEKLPELELAWHLLRKTMQESRRLMNGIRPPVLDDAGLVAAVEQLIVQEAAESPKVDFIKDPELGRFAPTLESAIYRIVQEALTNARMHSQSDKVRITLGQHDGQVRLEIQDWGVGFKATDVAQHRGGLKGFAERVRLAGGVLTINSSPGKGTRIIVELPVLQAV